MGRILWLVLISSHWLRIWSFLGWKIRFGKFDYARLPAHGLRCIGYGVRSWRMSKTHGARLRLQLVL